jgi:tetratricopeptide (TPR) repeat protein
MAGHQRDECRCNGAASGAVDCTNRAAEIDETMSRSTIWLIMGLTWLAPLGAGLAATSGARAGTEPASSVPIPSTQTMVQAASPAMTLTPEQVAQAQFDLGVELMRERKFAGAAQAFERATNARTNFPEAYNNWGISLVQLGKQAFNETQQLQDFQAAAEKFNKSVEQKSDVKLTYILWSETLLLIGDLPVDSRTRLACYQGAVEKCRKAAELAPHDWDSYNKWAVILSTKLPEYAVNDQARFALYQEAASLYAKAAERARFSSEVGPVYANWAGVLIQAAHISSNQEVKVTLLRQALEKFDRSAKVQPNAAGTYAMWGSALIDLGKISRMRNDFRDAVEKLNTSLELRPDDPGTLYNLARVYALLDQPVLAVQNLKRCFAADPAQVYRQTATRDTDLATLCGDTDFDELIGRTAARGVPTYNPHLSDSPQ